MSDPLKNPFTRLCTPQLTNIDRIKETVPKPKGYLPPRSLPTWKNMLVEHKIPLIPAPSGAIYFTRGDVGKSIIRKEPKPYETLDPLNKERVPSNIYEILHDPHERLQQDERLMKHLEDLNLINEEGQVLCSIKEFNRYREYLASLFNGKVREKLVVLDQLEAVERQQTRAFLLQENKSTFAKLRDERIQKALKFVADKKNEIQKKADRKSTTTMRQLALLDRDKQLQQVAKVVSNAKARELQEQRLKEKEEEEIKWRKKILHKVTLKDMTAQAQRNHVKQHTKIHNEKKMSAWFEAKLFSAAERAEREKEIQEQCSEQIRNRAKRRQERVEKFRDELPLRIATRLAEQQRLQGIVRKYAMRWLNRVRARLRKKKDVAHETLFSKSLKHCVKNLYAQSGHVKLDDLLFNILHFKEKIKKQIEKDEEEEEEG